MTASRPAGVPWLTPYLTVRDARAATAFFEAAFGFETRDSVQDDGVVMHVEMTYQGQLIVMFAPEGAFGSAAKTPKSAGAIAPQSFYVYVDDVDAVYAGAGRWRKIAERATGSVLGRPVCPGRRSGRLPLGARSPPFLN